MISSPSSRSLRTAGASPTSRSRPWAMSGSPGSSSPTSRASAHARSRSSSIPARTAGVCWSPDGSRLALNLFDDQTKERSIELVNLDGSALTEGPPAARPLELARLRLGDDSRRDCGPSPLDQPPDLKTTRGRYQALLEEYKTAFKAYDQARSNAKTARGATASRPRKVPPASIVYRPVPGDRRVGARGAGFPRRADLDRPPRL